MEKVEEQKRKGGDVNVHRSILGRSYFYCIDRGDRAGGNGDFKCVEAEEINMAKNKYILPEPAIKFQSTLDLLKRYTKWTDKEIGKRIGVTERTIRNARKNPFSVNAKTILLIQYQLDKVKERTERSE